MIKKALMITPEISVLMPVYNAEKYLKLAVASILNQSFTNFEFIIINDGSTDNTLAILESFAKQDKRIRLISRENKGLIATLNEGLILAKGPLIARMDADDISLPERFEKQLAYLESNPNYIAVGILANLIDSDGDLIGPFGDWLTHEEIDNAHIIGSGGAIIHPSAMIRRQYLINIGGYSEDYPHAEDLDLWLKLAEVGKLANLPDRLFQYRQHVGSIGYAHRQTQVQSSKKAVIEAGKRRKININFSDIENNKSEESSLAEIYIKWAWWALKAKNVSTSKKYAIKAILNNPFKLDVWKLLLCSIRGY